MPDASQTPVFAVVGHPNEGKSTVLSTLAEDDSVRVSPFPGETTACRPFPITVDGEEILRFVDTPGFQYPVRTLEWFQKNEDSTKNLAGSFREAHLRKRDFHSECELLSALADGAGVIYVADGSRPVESEDKVEMEILRLAGNPRMAVINSKEELPQFLEEWEDTARRYFNSVRLFNAHRARYGDRIALLESLKSIDQRWEPAIQRAIAAFREDWKRRISKTASALVVLLEGCVTCAQGVRWDESQTEIECRKSAEEKYFESIRKMEREFQKTVKRIYKHNLFEYEIGGNLLLAEDLFSARTMKVLGLSRGQFAGIGAVSGGVAGGYVDLHTGGASLLAGTLIGAGIGGALGYFSSIRLTEVRVANQKLGWREMVVRSGKHSNLPFILLDRALIYYNHATNWAHGRRELPSDSRKEIGGEKVGPTSAWEGERRKTCQIFLVAVRKRNPRNREEARTRLVEMLEEVLRETSG